jgi:hypothetical protein
MNTTHDYDPREYGMPAQLRQQLMRCESVRRILRNFPPEQSKDHYLNMGLPILHEEGETFFLTSGELTPYPVESPESILIKNAHIVFAGWAFADHLQGHIPIFLQSGKLLTWADAGGQWTDHGAARNATIENIIDAEILADNPNIVTLIKHYVDGQLNTRLQYSYLAALDKDAAVTSKPLREQLDDNERCAVIAAAKSAAHQPVEIPPDDMTASWCRLAGITDEGNNDGS